MMKCVKCGYISFDHNTECSKCGRDMTPDQQKLGLLNFMPDPPSLLGALTGEADESLVGLPGAAQGIEAAEPDVDVSLDEVPAEAEEEMVFDEGEDLDISLEPEQEIEVAEEEGFEIEEPVSDTDLEVGEDEISLDLGDMAIEEPAEALDSAEGLGEEEGELTVDLDDFSLEAPSAADELEVEQPVKEDEDIGIDLDSFELDFEETVGEAELSEEMPQEEGEIELKLDDLRVDETGELHIETLPEDLVGDQSSLEKEDFSLEEGPAEGEEEITLDLKDFTSEEALAEMVSPEKDDQDIEKTAVELDQMGLEELQMEIEMAGGEAEEEAKEDIALDLSDLSAEESPGELNASEEATEDFEKTLVGLEGIFSEEPGMEPEISEQTGEDENLIDLEQISLDAASTSKKKVQEENDEDFLDLDDLDLDLDLDDSDDKS
jgi:hypothetical protein